MALMVYGAKTRMLPLLDAFRTINWMDLRIEMEEVSFV
jgi:hypothetical protein